MASSSINSVLDNIKPLLDNIDDLANIDPELVKKEKYNEGLKIVKLESKLVRTFLLCARRWSLDGWKDARLEAFLSSLQDAVLYHAQAFCVLTEDGISFSDHLDQAILDFRAKFSSFDIEISTMYCSLRAFVVPSNLSALIDEVLVEFVDSLLENLVDVVSPIEAYDRGLHKIKFEALQEKLKFLKDFILFATWQGVESSLLKDPTAGLQAVAVQAADLSYSCWFDRLFDKKECNEMHSMISELLQDIKHLHSQFHESCIQGLRGSKLSGSLQTLNLEKDVCIAGDFADSLASILWEVLNHNTSFVVAKQDQMQMLYDGLRFLRTILKKQQEKFSGLHQKMMDLVGAAVNEAGILVLSLSANETEGGLPKDVDLGFSDLLQKIKLIRLVSSTLKSPGTNGLGLIKFLPKNLMELAELDFLAHSKDKIWTVQKDFVFLGSVFEKIAEQHNKHEKLKAFWSHVIEVANKVMFVINSFDLSPLSFDSILEELLLIKTEALEIDETYGSEAQKVVKTSNYVSSQGIIPVLNNGAVGFKDETERIINQVRHGSEKLDIVSIVGMPGLGKTTLAQRVYRDPSIIRDFHIRAWCNVSQVYCMKDLLLELLRCINPDVSKKYCDMDEQDLAHKLLNSLQRYRYFIVLDDIWDIDAWNILKRSFPDDKKRSRILITSRQYEVASQIELDREPHRLRQFTDDESWDLLQKMLFPTEPCRPELCTIGKQIAENCGGLPLTVVIVAGILATIEQDGWKQFAERMGARNVSLTEQSMNMLELSYRHVPDYLKPCLLYAGAFPQGQEIPIQRLLRLWIAEGFVKEVEQKKVEEVAEDYMMDLIGRSLIIVSKQRSFGGVKSCRVHDLVREFCATKAKEDFFQLLHGYEGLFTFSESFNTRRLCIYSKQEHFEKSRLFCPQIRCLMFFSHGDGYPRKYSDSLFIFQICKLLRVLDLGQVFLGENFPTEIEVLVELRYLAIRGMMQSIPSSIANLSNLETFILDVYLGDVMLPETIWNMTNLRHLCISGSSGDISLAKDVHENFSILYNLSTFSNLLLFIDPSMEKILRKFPNIRRLKCELSEPEDPVPDCSRIVKMNFLSQLESLSLSLYFTEQRAIQFHFPVNLKKLTLSDFSWSMISVIEELSNLEVLKLLDDRADQGDIWDASEEEEIPEEEVGEDFHGEGADEEIRWDITEEVEFPKLRILKLSRLNIIRWTGSGDHFPRLQKLILEQCWKLKEIPSCLGSNSPLEMIEIRWCPPSVVSLAEEVKEGQEEMGYEDLQILISAKAE
ncbi:putative late blight resistance protein homolog R1A-3 [Coffea eugenioides]|uniref:putative late blight resistance protein homolog R1A-3 n=1 Tax=Coffea eugenioides TaxID=49369 RepID=UPI000F614A09|nr:putative late blight resistance protein homolog R1A-3 [Coffea eugenioides]